MKNNKEKVAGCVNYVDVTAHQKLYKVITYSLGQFVVAKACQWKALRPDRLLRATIKDVLNA